MATPRTKTEERTPARRGPRRAAAPPRQARKPEDEIAALRDQLLATIAKHYPQADLGPVGSALDMAADAHAGQLRASGEPYVTHPIASAQILAELGIDPVAVQAALLHDVPEDTEYSLV